MARAIYSHELSDADFSWLINSYRESNPNALVIESACMPVIIIREGLPTPVPPVVTGDETENPDVDATE